MLTDGVDDDAQQPHGLCCAAGAHVLNGEFQLSWANSQHLADFDGSDSGALVVLLPWRAPQFVLGHDVPASERVLVHGKLDCCAEHRRQ